MSQLLIVIPAYNEEGNIVHVVNELVAHYPQYDYVVVNDGSRDHTAALCRQNGFRLIDLPVNLGRVPDRAALRRRKRLRLCPPVRCRRSTQAGIHPAHAG